MNPTPSQMTRGPLASAVLFGLLALMPAVSQADAWLPKKGNFSLSVDFTNILNKKHYTAVGNEIDAGHTDLRITSFAASYSPSDRLQISASLPFVESRYRGPGLGGHDHVHDNGSWHATFTDLQLTASYQLSDGPIAFAPRVGVIVPTHHYVTFGHSAPGRYLNEYWLGFSTATSLNEWIPRTYVQIQYNYAFVEKVADIAHDRSNALLDIGYYFNSSWSARVIASEQWTHGGIDVPVPLSSPLFPNHDRLAAEEFINVGAGVSWTINDRLSVYGLYMQAIEGKDAHKVDHRLSLGVNYGLGSH